MDRVNVGEGRENVGPLKKVGPTKRARIFDLPASIKGGVRWRMMNRLFELWALRVWTFRYAFSLPFVPSVLSSFQYIDSHAWGPLIQKTKGPLVVIGFAELIRPSRKPVKPINKEVFNDGIIIHFYPVDNWRRLWEKDNKKSLEPEEKWL